MAHDVFVSYHSDSSRPIADQVVHKMEQSGVICWYAPRNVQEKYVRDIMDAIQSCTIFVVLLNRAASESEFVLDEIAEAKECKKKIIVLQLTNETFSKESRLYLKRHHWVKVETDLDAAIDELVDRALLNLGRTKSKTAEKPRNQEVPSEFILVSYCGQKHQVKADRIKYGNGNLYIGEVRDGKPNGRGIKSFTNGDSYVGEWQNGRYHGKGVYTFASGAVYEGDFVQNKYHGKGKYTAKNGDIYEGDYAADKKCGQGTYTWVNGDLYEGEWADGKRSGKGKVTFTSGNVYEGDFVDSKYHGKGKYTAKNGDIYEGDYVADKKCGQGTYTWANGDVYEGEWADGKRNGFGTFKPAKGKILKGQFKDDQFIGH